MSNRTDCILNGLVGWSKRQADPEKLTAYQMRHLAFAIDEHLTRNEDLIEPAGAEHDKGLCRCSSCVAMRQRARGAQDSTPGRCPTISQALCARCNSHYRAPGETLCRTCIGVTR